MSGTFAYRLFGLSVRSEVELPELPPLDGDGPCDVTITIDRSPPPPIGQGIVAVPGGARLGVADVADYVVTGGDRIVVRPFPGAPDANVRLFLHGSAMGMLVHQRGLVPLHANAAEIDGGAVAFAGPSGSGKSTLAAWLHDRGARIVADDVCVIAGGSGGGPAMVMPGMPRFRLWRDALERSGRAAGDHPRSYAGDESYDKYDVAAAGVAVADRPLPLRAIYLLERGERLEIEPMHGIAAADALFANTYRGEYLAVLGAEQSHWRACLAILATVPLYRLRRRWGAAVMDVGNEALLARL